MKASIELLFKRLGYRITKLDETGSWMTRVRFDALAYQAVPNAKLEKRAFYNIGAGNFRHKFWTNVDMPSEWYSNTQADDVVSFDLESLDPLPIETASAEAVYTSHTIEHVSDNAVDNPCLDRGKGVRKGDGGT